MIAEPRISIIIPLYNKAATIIQTVESVLNQEFDNFEILIIDDGSTDGSRELLRQIDDKRIRIISKVNGGVSDARNFGIKHSQTPILFFLDADDILYPNALTIFIQLLDKYPDISVFSTNFNLVSSKGLKSKYCLGEKETKYSSPLKALWKNQIFPRTGALMIKRECIDKIGYFNTKICIFEDLDFVLRLLNSYDIVYSPSISFDYQLTYNELSKNIKSIDKELIYYADLSHENLYARLILVRVWFFSLMKRLSYKDYRAVHILINKSRKHFLFVIYALIYGLLLSLKKRIYKKVGIGA